LLLILCYSAAQLLMTYVNKSEVPVANEKDNIVFWLKQFDNVEVCSTVYKKNILYLCNKNKTMHVVVSMICNTINTHT